MDAAATAAARGTQDGNNKSGATARMDHVFGCLESDHPSFPFCPEKEKKKEENKLTSRRLPLSWQFPSGPFSIFLFIRLLFFPSYPNY